jgi:hypothetical protein
MSKIEKPHDEALCSAMNAQKTGSIVTAAFKNDVPRNDVHVIEVGANFYYDDHTVETRYDTNLWLSTGESHPIISTQGKKCCVSVYGVFKVLHDGDDPVLGPVFS